MARARRGGARGSGRPPTWKLVGHFAGSFLEYGIDYGLEGVAILVLELCHVSDVSLRVVHDWQNEALLVLDPLKPQLKQRGHVTDVVVRYRVVYLQIGGALLGRR